MGNLLKIFNNNNGDLHENYDVFVDFENCKPSESEIVLWNEINSLLSECSDILDSIRKYDGASKEITTAITKSQDCSAQKTAWDLVVPLVLKLKRFYEFGIELSKLVPKVLRALSSNDMTVTEHLEKQQALFKQFAEILDFVLEFDALKMSKPSIQNDFSYYKRTMSRVRTQSSRNSLIEVLDEKEILDIGDNCCNNMSLFYAESTPMLRLIIRQTNEQKDSEGNVIPADVTSECLAVMANICLSILSKPEMRNRLSQPDTRNLCLRVMTGAIILADHIDPEGVFRKSSKLDVKSCLKQIKEDGYENTDYLLKAIRFSSIHANDDTTSKSVKHILGIE